ncbi:DUF262 domain-containing protein [Geobacter sp. DSM 9736]|uniref:DUF262 domain-containing protein n=1 Tax=Geobacter sp. DSM 9736 TaxID=1277350 RepID=UPI000B511FFB|nr:DUF262 domain-containing protein [Geobacter sp. DSM 9736]SNB46290.1 Protein of unknown function DUF262 [Geobacter sp. DSM 9736]
MADLFTDYEFANIFKKHLKISTRSIAVRTMLSDRNIERINYKPYYQRNYVWDRAKASFFIESVLLGTEVPPLIFFKSGKSIEVIDGRQRFETLKKYRENDFSLGGRGLLKLQFLHNVTFNKLTPDLQELFLNSKIRIFEFEVIDEPKLPVSVEDKIKKEIFRRYNTGITPLKSDELENAKYDSDELTGLFKEYLKEDKAFLKRMAGCFTAEDSTKEAEIIATLLDLIRRYMVLSSFPIKTYARGNKRTEIRELLYEFITENIEDPELEFNCFKRKMETILKIHEYFASDTNLSSRLIYECLLWAISVLEKEEYALDIDDNILLKLRRHYGENYQKYETADSHYYKNIIERFQDTAYLMEKLTRVNFDIYIKDDTFRNRVKDLMQSEEEASLTLDELSNLRVLKPDPTSVPVEELLSEVTTNRFLLRPSYQRQEKINVVKASSIIESILLGIYLPPIFIFKNQDGVKEVVDGQQRLLSILGFLGRAYINEEGKKAFSKNNHFNLKSLKILNDLNGSKYPAIDPSLKDKILDFDLNIIEIDSTINQFFSPIDLFIRLNSKPYPIMENSFEMWNSSADNEVIQAIKDLTDENIDWFFIRAREASRNKDRMENEELITILAYFDFAQGDPDYRDINAVDFYPKQDRLNCRVNNKRNISSLLHSFEDQHLKKKQFLLSIQNVHQFINNLKIILDAEDLKASLNQLLNVKGASPFSRAMQDLYLVWAALASCDNDIIASNAAAVRNDLTYLLRLFKNVDNNKIDEEYLAKFVTEIKAVNQKYR